MWYIFLCNILLGLMNFQVDYIYVFIYELFQYCRVVTKIMGLKVVCTLAPLYTYLIVG